MSESEITALLRAAGRWLKRTFRQMSKMQDTAHLKINGQVYLVLRRPTRYGVALKLRIAGKPGRLLDDESVYLAENLATLEKLLSGHTIYI